MALSHSDATMLSVYTKFSVYLRLKPLSIRLQTGLPTTFLLRLSPGVVIALAHGILGPVQHVDPFVDSQTTIIHSQYDQLCSAIK